MTELFATHLMRVFGLAVVRRLLHAGLCDILPLRGAPYVHRGFYHCLVLRSCTCPLRINTAGSPGCLSQEQKGLDEGARMASQRPSHPCGRPRRRPCGRTSPAQAPSPCCFPSPQRPHTPAGWGHGGTRKHSTSRSVQTCSVRPAAIAGVRDCQRLAEPWPLAGRGCGHGWRKLACGRQKL